MGPSKRRGYPLRRWLRLGERTGVRRRVMARQEQEPQPDLEADGWEGVRLRYSQWGCNAPPPPPSQRSD